MVRQLHDYLVVNRVNIHARVPAAERSHATHVAQLKNARVRAAQNRRFAHAEVVRFFVEVHRLDLSRVAEQETEEQKAHNDQVLPPVPFSVAFEYYAEAGECDVVEQVERGKCNEYSYDP